MIDMQRKQNLLVSSVALSSLAALAADSSDRQLLNLHETPKQNRFEITDRVWPEQPGAAHICLWKDDKLCALSITIDDNTAPDHAWWIEQGEKYGWRFTWFVITGQVGAAGGYFGSWPGFAKLRDLGHDVQSHTVTHLSMAVSKGVEWEYSEAIKVLQTHFPQQKAFVLAYPGGKNSQLNDRDLAAKYYLAARGTSGHPNAANRIDYLRTNSVGRITLDNPKASWADFRHLLVRNPRRPRNYRGWYSVHVHRLNEKLRSEFAERFEFIKQNEDDIWVGLWREVAQYGQERDTAKLSVGSNTAGAITFTLTDQMKDEVFDLPLTVKTRLPEGWTGVAAHQSGKSLSAIVVEHEGKSYALVQTVPDRGKVDLRPGVD